MKDERLYLTHILESIIKIEKYTIAGKEVFFNDEKTQDAVVRNLQTLTESVKYLSNSSREKQSHIPWKSLIGFRNVLVHNYLGIDLDRVWAIVENDLSSVKIAVENLLEGS